MREIVLSNCEKTFVQRIVGEGHRLDGRIFNESRHLEISFGSDYGSCIVSLGETKVLAQVTCEVTQPKQIRPNEGMLYVNVEIGPMAGSQFESNRQSDLVVYLARLLERCYKDSKCIDLESLCIVVEEKVWSLRVDVRVINHDGNLVECASIATLSALAHFKRPDVTRSGDTVIIHTIAEKDPIPTVLYHYPVCTAFAVFNEDTLVSDPDFLEMLVCTSNTEEGINKAGSLLIVGMNQYKEVCLLDLTGAALINSNIIQKSIARAADRCKDVVDHIKKVIALDDNARQRREKINFSEIVTTQHKLSLCRKDLKIRLKNYNADDIDMDSDDSSSMSCQEIPYAEDDKEDSKYDVISSEKEKQTVELKVKKGASQWIEISSDSEED